MADINFDDLKQLLIKNCMLRVSPDEIKEETPFFGPGSLGLDSIDALQMTAAIEQNYGIPIKTPEEARKALQSLAGLKEWLIAEMDKKAKAA